MNIIKYFTMLQHIGSISKAANFLNISQPAITKYIQKLEQELKITLFSRNPKGVKLTESGEVFFDYIKNGVESFLNGERKLTSLNNLETGTLKIGASTTITKYILMPYIEKFHKQYPKINISITNNLTQALISELKKGSLDLVIANLPMNLDSSLKANVCAKLQDCFVSNLEYKNQINKKISLKELVQNYPIITQKEPSNTRTFIDILMNQNDIQFEPQIEVASYSLVKDFARIGMGISYVTKEFAETELKNKELYEIQIKEKIPTRDVGILTVKSTILPIAAKKFIEIIL